MSKPPHTPGPWEWEDDETLIHRTSGEKEIVLQFADINPKNRAIVRAAPEMLGALIQCANTLDAMKDEFKDELRELIVQVAKAIAKAEGRE